MKKLLMALLLVGGIANAELISNVPLDVSRFELMEIGQLVAHAQSGNHHAQFFLAKRMQKGEGVAANPKNAAYWYEKAAKQGIAPAQLNLGIMHLKGEGVIASKEQARFWLEKAAYLGDNRASYTLAILDEKEKRFVDAYKWYDLSTRDIMLDDTVKNKARGKIGQLALNLSSSEIESAKTSANSWFQSK